VRWLVVARGSFATLGGSNERGPRHSGAIGMVERATKPDNIDEYIARFARPTQRILQKIRATVAAVAPGAEEVISYRMPAFRQNGILLYFAGFSHHIGV
jgi:hypothetical protein